MRGRWTSSPARRGLVLAFYGLLALPWDAPLHAKQDPSVFVLHSYSQEYPWTKRQHEGFMRGLEAFAPHAIAVNVEYLDTKRVPYTAEYADIVARYLAQKYAGYHPDAIYVSDDDALVFARSHLAGIFSNTPVFFSGINDYDVRAWITPDRFTGIFERKDIHQSLVLMKRLMPGVSDILLVGDDSGTDQDIRRDVVAELARHPELHARILSGDRIEHLVEALRASSARVVFLTTIGAVKDATGHVLPLPKIIAAIRQAGPFVILSMEDAYLYPGVVGGYVTSGPRQGEAAAEMIVRYLSGTAVSNIAPVETSPNECIFDGRELAQAGLRLPPDIARGATILNPPPTFHERYLRFIVGMWYALALLFLLLLGGTLRMLVRKNRQISESEANFRTFFASMSDMILVSAPDGRILFTNPAVSRTLGYDAKDLAARHILDLHPASKRPEAEGIFAAMLGGERDVCSLPLETKAGVLVPAETRVWLGRWNGRNCIFGVSKNLTSEQEAQQRFERLFRNNPTLMALSDFSDRRFSDVNDAFLAATGYAREEVLGKTAAELGLFPHPEQQQAVTTRLLNEGHVANFELQIRRKDGALLHGLFSGEMVSNQGKRHFLTVMINITARKQAEEALQQSEEKFRSIVDSSPTAMYFYRLDADNRLILIGANPAADRDLGAPHERLLDKTLAEVFPKLTDTEIPEKCRKVALGGIGPQTFEIAYRDERFDGCYAVNVFLTSPRVIAIGFADITQRKQAEEKLRNTLGALERHNRLMVGRESRVVELKKEVNALLHELGRPTAYSSVAASQAVPGDGKEGAP